MKQYTSKDQTAKLIELGFPKPKTYHNLLWDEDDKLNLIGWQINYSVGELIELLQSIVENNEVRISTYINVVSFNVMTEEGRCGYSFNGDELIDSLYEACVTLKEEGVI